MVINFREKLNTCQKELEQISYKEPDDAIINNLNKRSLRKLYKLVEESKDLSAEINQKWGKKDTKNDLKFFLSNLKRKIIEFETKRVESGNYREFPIFSDRQAKVNQPPEQKKKKKKKPNKK